MELASSINFCIFMRLGVQYSFIGRSSWIVVFQNDQLEVDALVNGAVLKVQMGILGLIEESSHQYVWYGVCM